MGIGSGKRWVGRTLWLLVVIVLVAGCGKKVADPEERLVMPTVGEKERKQLVDASRLEGIATMSKLMVVTAGAVSFTLTFEPDFEGGVLMAEIVKTDGTPSENVEIQRFSAGETEVVVRMPWWLGHPDHPDKMFLYFPE